MTKEERKQLYKELKENMFGPSGDDNDEHKDKYVTLKSGKRVKID